MGCSGQQKIKIGNHTFQAIYFKILAIRHLFESQEIMSKQCATITS